MGFPPVPGNETMHPSEVKVITEVGFHETHKVDGSDHLSPTLFRNDGEVLTSKLRKLLSKRTDSQGVFVAC